MASTPMAPEDRRDGQEVVGEEAFRRLGALLRHVEKASAEGAGALHLLSPDGEVLGTVMAEEGRACWASARASPHHLSTFIARETGMEMAELRTLFNECRSEGIPFGECLVSRRLVRPEVLRRLLLEQTAIALGNLVRADAGCSWSEWEVRDTRTYRPRYTFTSGEVVSSVMEHDLEMRLAVPEVPSHFAAALSDESASGGVLMLVLDAEAGEVLPVRITTGVVVSMEDTRQLFRSARGVLLAPALVAVGGAAELTFLRRENRVLAVARDSPYLLVTELTEPSGAASSLMAAMRHRDVARRG